MLRLSRRERGTEMHVNDAGLKRAIEEELSGSGCFVGYRKMWARLKLKGIFVKRSRVMVQLRELDPRE